MPTVYPLATEVAINGYLRWESSHAAVNWQLPESAQPIFHQKILQGGAKQTTHCCMKGCGKGTIRN